MNLKQKLSKKLKKTGGFTLIEMLIVVAIIAILVAVSIPMVNSSLNKARTATDDANERAAKGAALVTYMDELPDGASVTYCYDAEAGSVTDITTAGGACTNPEPYGQGSPDDDAASTPRKGHIHVTVTAATGETSITWED